MKRNALFLSVAVTFFLSLAVLLVGVILSFDVYIRDVVVSGPFPPESPESSALIVDLRGTLPARKLFSTGGDGPLNPYQSTLRARLAHQELSPSHTLHDRIRTVGDGAFSHWDDSLIFSLPPGAGNTTATSLAIQYAVRLRPSMISAAFFLFALSGLFLVLRFRAAARESYEEKALIGLRLAGQVMNAIFLLVLAATAFFLATVVFGVLDGYALPNTAVFRLFPQAEALGHAEPAFGHAILVYALVGASCSWFASITPAHSDMFRAQEASFFSLFNRFGALAIVGLFLFSVGGTWAGIPRPQDLSGNAIAGLVPFNDALGHFELIFSQVLTGIWDPFMTRRPFAAAFRTVGMTLSGFNNLTFLLGQTVALALATFLSVRAVMYWRGVWAGMTYLGLTFILLRHYLPTNLTEPLGIFWALASIPFFVQALRTSHLFQAVTGFHLTCWALLIRMGSMFTIPALGIWVVITQFGNIKRLTAGVVIVVVALLANFALVSGLSKLYGSEGGATGSNFSHTICGLTHNTDWVGCVNLYAENIKSIPNEAELAKFFYARALEKFRAEPSLLFKRLIDGETYFLSGIWERVLTGYTGTIPALFPKQLWTLFVVVGLARVLISRKERHELSFWGLVIGSVFVSAPFVIYDDGWRVLCTSFPLFALLIASAFSSPISLSSCQLHGEQKIGEITKIASISFIALVAFLSLVVPGLAYKWDILEGQRYKSVTTNEEEELLLATKHMSGFLVVPDGVLMPNAPPSIPWSAFVAIVKNSGIEQYQKLIAPALASSPPFGVVAAPRYKKRSNGLLIVPPRILEDRDTSAWKVRLVGDKYWYRVVQAEPVPHSKLNP